MSAKSKARLCAHMQGLLLPGGSLRAPSGVTSAVRPSDCTGLCCAQRLCWKGTARCPKDILRLCSVVPDSQAEQLVYVVYTDCSVGSAGI